MAKTRQPAPRRAGLARAREAAGLTQEAFATLAGVEVSTIVRWESGTTTPLPGKRPRIARALGIGLPELERLLTPEGSRGTAGLAAFAGLASTAPGEPDDTRPAAIAALRAEIARLTTEYEARPTPGLLVRAAGMLARVEALREAEVAERAAGKRFGGGAGVAGAAVSAAGSGLGGDVPGPVTSGYGGLVFGEELGQAARRSAAGGSGSAAAGSGRAGGSGALAAGDGARGFGEAAVPTATGRGAAGRPGTPSAAGGAASVAPSHLSAATGIGLAGALPPRWRRDLDIAEAETALLVGRLLAEVAGRRDASAAEELFDRAARRAGQAGDSVLQASAVLRSAFLGLYGGDPRAGIRRCAQAAVIAAPVSRALFALARLHAAEGHAMLAHAGECDRALAAARAALAVPDAEDPAPDACPPPTYQRLAGAAYLALGRHAEARAALSVAAAGHAPGRVLAVVVGQLSLACLGAGDVEAALEHLRSAIVLAEATGSPQAMAVAFRAGRELMGVSGGVQAMALETVERLLAMSAMG